MTSGATISKKFRLLSAVNLAVSLVIGAILVTFTAEYAANISRTEQHDKAGETLSVQAEVLTGLLEKYRLLPALLANRPDVAAHFADDTSPKADRTARRILIDTAARSGALEITMLSADGQKKINAFGLLNDPLTTQSPAIAAALEGRLGRELRILKDGTHAYLFATSMRDNGNLTGVIGIYVGLDTLQEHWTLTAEPIIAVDENSKIIMSNREQWRGRAIDDVTKEMNGDTYFVDDGQTVMYLNTSRNLPLLGWDLCVLSDLSASRFSSTFWGIFTALMCALVAVIIHTLIQTRYLAIKRTRQDRAVALRLERTVRERTRDLIESNTTLAREVEERRQTETQLRQAQDELIQTGKLAALGQMSTSLAHEFNQPLAATKSYADNAITLIKRGRIDEARDNIGYISDLADRMADISNHLKNFARKPTETRNVVSLQAVIDDAIKILSSRLREDGAQIQVDVPDQTFVRAGNVRLQQVIINLVLNALDAMKDQDNPKIEISTSHENDRIITNVRDFGPGISNAGMEFIFDPFYTTKPVGQGLGLGLSISYNIVKDFGGQLSVRNYAGKGAEFRIALHEGEKLIEAAE